MITNWVYHRQTELGYDTRLGIQQPHGRNTKTSITQTRRPRHRLPCSNLPAASVVN
ncbi:hypothetical protein RSAG8_02939, partial [Rhizoctonia solani AG-8 WAC10335]